MMEVKQNTAVDLNDLLTSSKSNGADETDDNVMPDLADRHPDLMDCEIIKANDKTPKVDDISNGDVDMSSLINDVEDDTDISVPVNPELEDALLAGDDVLPELDSKDMKPVSAVAEDYILADKVETSNSTTSSNNLRDPGDDLDTLLSKINDIVEDCIDNEGDNNASEKPLEPANIQTNNTSAVEKSLNETIAFVEETEANTNHEIINEKDDEQNSHSADNIETVSSIQPSSENLVKKIDNDSNNVINEIAEEKPDITYSESEKEINSIFLDKVAVTTDVVVTTDAVEPTDAAEPIDSAEPTDAAKPTDATESTEVTITTEVAVSQEEKTKQSNFEIAQDNDIYSKNNGSEEKSKTESHDEIDKAINLKYPINPTLNKEVSAENGNDLDDTKNKTTPDHNKEISAADTKLNQHNENEDSDDEIVFYVDKPPEIKEGVCQIEDNKIDTSTKELLDKEENDKIKTQTEESSERKTNQEDDDVVLLLDDDEEEANQSVKKETIVKNNSSKVQKESKNDKNDKVKETELTTVESKDLEMDNSDNARDDFVCEKSNDEENIKDKIVLTETPEEANSNCSSSSNLLQEAKSVENASEEQTPEDCENEEEDDEGEVEVIESDLKETGSTTKVDDSELPPPPKRLRLSNDSVESLKPVECSEELNENNTSAKNNELTEDIETKMNTDTLSPTLKRTHDVIELETDEKSNDSKASNEIMHKKPRTTEMNTEKKPVEIVGEDEKSSEDLKSEMDSKNDIKAVPSYQPIPLYPPPKFETIKSESSFKLDFLKKFRKSFDNMTKQDLEELVLQKVVEAIIHRSEFSEMRELIEKQEKLITAHRSRISELSKQFRDLEMVHNRVVKDIEQRNSQFIMPVKITRAVGLQVYIPNKKSMTETASSSGSSSNSSTTTNVPLSPQRPLVNQAPSAPSSSVNPLPQRQFITSQTETQQQRSGSSIVNTSANAGGIRRGCVQKITPTRPVPGTNPTPPAVPTAYRNTPNQTVSTQPRILNKNATQTTNATAVQRSRYLGSNQDGQRLQSQQQISRPPNIATSGPRAGPITAQAKITPNASTVTQRSSVSSSTSSIVDNYINTLTHLTGNNTAVSITPAKPKEKAVIDLTDEDEAPAPTPSVQPVTQIPVANVQRRSLPGQNNTNSPLQYGRSAPALQRISPANQIANNKNRQMSSIQAQKNNSFPSISTPPGTSITRINVSSNAANVQRVKYSHPAPLPATPPQAFNPAWKLPPPRPTIRISNLDNGIVISWTMEESMDRHAECVSYQIYAYQETSGPPMVDSWRHVGDVKAMLLPMAVTLTQFQEGQRYFFAVRAVDCHQRFGPFSLPKTWS